MNKTTDKATPAQHEDFRPLIDWWKKNGVRSLISLAVVIAAVSAVTWYRRGKRGNEQQASQAFPGADSIMKLETYANRYAGTKPAVTARLKLAKAYYDAGRYPLALETYDAFLADHPDHPMADIARMGRPHALEAMGRHNEALAEFDRFAADNPGHYLEGPAVFGAARCIAVLRNQEDAIQRIEQFLETRPESAWAEQAYAEIEWIKVVDHESLEKDFFESGGTNIFNTITPEAVSAPAPVEDIEPPVLPPADGRVEEPAAIPLPTE